MHKRDGEESGSCPVGWCRRYSFFGGLPVVEQLVAFEQSVEDTRVAFARAYC